MAVFTSKLAIKAVQYLKDPGSRSVRRSSCHSQCLSNILVSKACMCSQLTSLSAPTSRFLHLICSFSSCSRSTRTVAYHLGNTLSRSHGIHEVFQVWRRVFVEKKKKAQDTPSLWGSSLSFEPLCEPVGDLVHRLHGQILHYLGHQAAPRAVFFLRCHSHGNVFISSWSRQCI